MRAAVCRAEVRKNTYIVVRASGTRTQHHNSRALRYLSFRIERAVWRVSFGFGSARPILQRQAMAKARSRSTPSKAKPKVEAGDVAPDEGVEEGRGSVPQGTIFV